MNKKVEEENRENDWSVSNTLFVFPSVCVRPLRQKRKRNFFGSGLLVAAAFYGFELEPLALAFSAAANFLRSTTLVCAFSISSSLIGSLSI